MTDRIGQIERLHLGLLGVAVCAAYVTGWVSAFSVLVGGTAMGINFRLLRAIVARLIAPAGGQNPALMIGLVLAKFAVFIALLGVLFSRVTLDPLGVAVGATMLLVACVIGTVGVPAPVHT
ncbi:MAG: ATP synthase subunit I [Candidatus Binatia bacterium]